MKKVSLLLSALLFSVAFYSQNNNTKVPSEPIRQSNISLGVKGGFGHSFIAPYRNFGFNPSWNAGLSALLSPWAHWGLGMDVVWSSEGATFIDKSDDIKRKYQTEQDYIRVPIKAIYFFHTYERDFRPKVSFGPTVGFLVSESKSAGTRNFDAGATLTAGFNYRLIRAVWLTVDATYYQGLVDTYTGNAENDLNGNMRLDLGVSFGF